MLDSEPWAAILNGYYCIISWIGGATGNFTINACPCSDGVDPGSTGGIIETTFNIDDQRTITSVSCFDMGGEAVDDILADLAEVVDSVAPATIISMPTGSYIGLPECRMDV